MFLQPLRQQKVEVVLWEFRNENLIYFPTLGTLARAK